MKQIVACLIVSAAVWTLFGSTALGQGRVPPDEALDAWLRHLDARLPRSAADYSAETPEGVAEASRAIEQWATRIAEQQTDGRPRQVADAVRLLLDAKIRVDGLLDTVFEVRRQFAGLEASARQREALRGYLQTSTELISLSGRLRYVQVDGLGMAYRRVAGRERLRAEMVDLFAGNTSSVGALIAARHVIDSPGTASAGEIRRLLELIEASGQTMLLPHIVTLLEHPGVSDALKVAAAKTVRAIGLPQDPRPGSAADLPRPVITAARLSELLAGINRSSLDPGTATLHGELMDWLRIRQAEGLVEESYPLGNFSVQPGDWLLMRNPSPYNQFTDLSPGLFTHVGVVAMERGSDGIARMVLVDLPERGTQMPATNVEIFVQRTLHYVFLRHPDPAVARSMAEAARQVIGNPTRFDLSFRTDRVLPLAHQPLAGKEIHTYCAGLLLLCALQTPLERSALFPIEEGPAGGRTLDNLATLGLSIGEGFISPTGALFSPELMVVGRCEPMYDPRREVEEAIFDYFAELLATRKLQPSPDLFQSLRLKLAEASRTNPVLAQALARAARVDEDIDLVSAAKAAAVVETLDEIAFGASGEFLDARDVIRSGPLEALAREGLGPEELALARRYRQRHQGLVRRLEEGRLSPRSLREELVSYYIEMGKRQIERRFFLSERQDGKQTP